VSAKRDTSVPQAASVAAKAAATALRDAEPENDITKRERMTKPTETALPMLHRKQD
jgi:phage gp36-like protein